MNQDKDVSMNEELREWAQEAKKQLKLEEGEDYSKRKPKGMCQICGEKKARFVCLKCGRSVCLSCYFKIIGVCKKCVPPEIAGKWDGSRTDWEEKLGVEWVE